MALVTGASRGIGRAIAVALAQEGADIAVNYAKNREAADQLCEELAQSAVCAKAYAADVANAQQVKDMISAVMADLGPVSILVNCAGITRDKTFTKMTREQWDEVMATNLGGPFNVTQSLLPAMLELGWGGSSTSRRSSANGVISARPTMPPPRAGSSP